jgi:hypothetical protein
VAASSPENDGDRDGRIHTLIKRGRTGPGAMGTKRTTLRLDDERQRRLDRAKAIIASDPDDDPPNSKVIDAALMHLVESKENIESARDDVDPKTIQTVANTSVLGLRYRTRVESRYR